MERALQPDRDRAAGRQSPLSRLPVFDRLAPLATAGLAVLAAGLALLPMPYNVVAVVGVATVVLTLIRPSWALYLVFLSVPLQDLGAPRLGDLVITATKVAVPLALIAWLALRMTRGGLSLALAWLTVPYGLYVAVLAASTLSAFSQNAALIEMSRWLQAFGILLMTLDLIRTRRGLALLVGCLLVGGLVQAVLGTVQSLIGAGPASFAVTAGLSRAYGTFGMPNSYAGYLEMSLPLALMISVYALKRGLIGLVPRRPLASLGGQSPGERMIRRSGTGRLSQRLVLIVAPLVLLWLSLGIALSFSRGAWLGTAVGLATMVAVASRRSLMIGLSLGGLLLAMAGIGADGLLPVSVSERLTSIVDSFSFRDVRTMVVTPANFAVAERMAMWQAGLNMFESQPIIGVGAGNFNVVYDLFRVPQFLYSRGHAHNYYIHVAAETGVIGLLAYGLLVVGAAVDIGRGLARIHDEWLRALVIAAAGTLTAVMTHNLVENLHVLNMNLHFFAVLTMPAVAQRLTAAASIPKETTHG